MTRTTAAALLGVVLSMLASWDCFADERSPPILNPKTYTSQSGVHAILVDPTDLHGRGAADYQFTSNGKTAWTSRLPFTLWDAVVADNGCVAGYAYTHGRAGFARKGINAGMGEFIVVLLSAEGKILNKETHVRESSRYLHTPPDPLAKGMLLDEYGKRFIVRVRDPDINRGIEQWWVFDLGSGKRVGVLEPATLMARTDASISILDAQSLPGTPLILTHWWKLVYPQCGAVFTLVDPQGKPVWSLSLDDDYTVPGDDDAQDRIREMIWAKGAILAVNKSPGFDIHLVKDHKRASFSVAKVSDGSWQVRETARRPFELSKPVEKPADYPPVSPEKLGVVSLGDTGGKKDTGIRDVEGFAFDGKGRICTLVAEPNSRPRLLLVSQEGAILHDLPLPMEKVPETSRLCGPAHVGGGKFVVTMSGWKIGDVASCFWADFEAASVGKLPDFDCPTVEALAGFEDGRFAALTNRRAKYTMSHGLFFFDSRGKCLWKMEEDGYSGKPEDLLSPEDIARCGADAIAVLDVIRHTVQLFDLRGQLVRTIDLNKAWGREPNYPTNVAADSPDGFVVYDFNAKAPLVRMDKDGPIRSEVVPRFADGRPFRVTGGVKCAPQGQLWTSDGNAPLRLAPDGAVDRILGAEPKVDALSQPEHVTVDSNDRIYVADRRTHAVHLFDASGKKIGVCVPDAKDLSETSMVQHIAVSPTGDVFVQLDIGGGKSYVRFGNDLKRRGIVHVELDSVSQDWCFQPSGDLCWIGGYNDVFLVKDLRDTVRTISRRADRRWLEYPQAMSVAPDGSIAVLAHGNSREASVSTYGPNGDALATFTIPSEWWWTSLAYDGERVFIRYESDVFMLDPSGCRLGRFSLGSDTSANDWNGPYLADKGKQLWFVDGECLTLHKYAAPVSGDKEIPSRRM